MNNLPLYLWMPAVAAVGYAGGALFFKEAFRRGAGTLHTFVLTSWIMALFFSPFIFFEKNTFKWDLIHYPLLTACAFFIGHWLTFKAIRIGDVSLVTPVMGTKSIFVAFFAWFIFSNRIPGGMWIAALLTAMAIYILGKTDQQKKMRRVPLATGLTIISSACFGMCDAMVQEWAPAFGVKAFLSLLFGAVALMTSTLVPFFDKPIRELERGALAWLIGGAILTGQQAILVALSVSLYDNATGVNVVYSSRGLWAILLVWLTGRIFGTSTEHSDARKLWLRCAGAALMCVAIWLAVLAS